MLIKSTCSSCNEMQLADSPSAQSVVDSTMHTEAESPSKHAALFIRQLFVSGFVPRESNLFSGNINATVCPLQSIN